MEIFKLDKIFLPWNRKLVPFSSNEKANKYFDRLINHWIKENEFDVNVSNSSETHSTDKKAHMIVTVYKNDNRCLIVQDLTVIFDYRIKIL